MSPRILIVDDHEIVREGIRTLLNGARPDWEICGEAANADEAVEAFKKLNPDLVVLDITMPGMSGLDASRAMKKLRAESRTLIFTMHDSSQLGAEVRDAGAQGFVLKSQAARDLVRAIETVLNGGTFFGTAGRASPAKERHRKGGFSLSECAAFA
jgi:two-component system, NarL family, invasion response regulator UvrY